jgi:hypothetical protein
MPSYQTLREERKRFGRNSYLEVSRQKMDEPGARGPTEFILVTRGWIEKDGSKKWSRFVTLPDDPDMVRWLAKTLQEVSDGRARDEG